MRIAIFVVVLVIEVMAMIASLAGSIARHQSIVMPVVINGVCVAGVIYLFVVTE